MSTWCPLSRKFHTWPQDQVVVKTLEILHKITFRLHIHTYHMHVYACMCAFCVWTGIFSAWETAWYICKYPKFRSKPGIWNTSFSAFWKKGCSVCLCTENESVVDQKGFCSESQKNKEGAALRKIDKFTLPSYGILALWLGRATSPVGW